MHSFQHLDLKTLRKICSKYNLCVKIAKYSKLSKEQLIPHMEKHLHINEHGKIKMRDGVCDNVSSELNKMMEEIHAKINAVKEKMKKPKEKKEAPNVKELKEAVKKHYKKKALELHPDKNIGNEEEAKKKFQKLKNSYDKKMEEIKMLEDKKASPKKGLNMKEQAMKEIIQMQKEQKTKAPPPNIKPKPPTMPPPAHLKKGLNLGGVKIPQKTFEKAKAEKEALIPKIDMIQQELHKLEMLIHHDEKENAKEHHKLEEEIHENINVMKPQEKRKMTKKEAKEEAKKYKIALTFVENGKRKNKPVYMLQQELKYEKKKEKKAMKK